MVKIDPELCTIISENPEFFDDNTGIENGTANTILIFLLHEWQKGADSFWKPWLDVMPIVEQFHDWDEELIEAT